MSAWPDDRRELLWLLVGWQCVALFGMYKGIITTFVPFAESGIGKGSAVEIIDDWYVDADHV